MKVSANDQLNIALIGCREMGWNNLRDTMNHPGLNCIGLCDIDSNILANRAAEAEKNWGRRPTATTAACLNAKTWTPSSLEHPTTGTAS